MGKIQFVFLIISFSIIYATWAAAGDKSKSKCKEYAKYVYAEEDSPVLSRRASKDKVSQCGIVEVPLVIGGIEAAPKEFPHMVLVGYGTSPDDPSIAWRCGGTLISEIFVLTAAHCTKNQSGKPQKVRAGELNLETTDESETQDRPITEIINHPEHKPSQKYNDIALLRLASKIVFNAYVRPACLNADHNVKELRVIATGFGKTSFDASEGSKKLMKVPLNIIKKNKCTTYFNNEIEGGSLANGINEKMMCAGELKGGKDTCQGDSGGPLQVVLADPYCMYSIVGVVSFGKFCGFANQPAIYTNVAFYISWIENIAWP